MGIGALVFMIVALICYAIIASSQGDGEIKGAASNIENLLNDAQLSGNSLWTITIFRKSGYLHDVRECMGDANAAISEALASCRRSGIENIIITKNGPAILEFYSANQDGRGQAIGGFLISAAQQPEAPNSSGAAQTGINDLNAQLEEARRSLAKSLLDSIKPNMSEKQAEILGVLPEDEIIEIMVAQLEGVEQLSGKPFNFVIPINYTCKDGVRYDDIPLTITVGDVEPNHVLTRSHISNQPEHLPSPNGSLKFPDQDFWEEAVDELGGRSFRCDVKLGFSYADSNGIITTRQIRAKAFMPWSDSDHLILGFCNLRKEDRRFLTSRMEGVTDLETGKYIYDVDRYLTQAYQASDYKRVDDFIDLHMSVVECLIYLAKLDGNITKAQNWLIASYMAKVSGVATLTEQVATKLIRDFAGDITPQEFHDLLDQMRREQPENIAVLREMGQHIVGARRGNTARGQAALASI